MYDMVFQTSNQQQFNNINVLIYDLRLLLRLYLANNEAKALGWEQGAYGIPIQTIMLVMYS